MKQAIRQWLIEHLNFVPREDYDLRLDVLRHMSKHALELEREVEILREEREEAIWRWERSAF